MSERMQELRAAVESAEQRLERARDFFGVPRTYFERKSIRYRLRDLQRAIEAELAEIERTRERGCEH